MRIVITGGPSTGKTTIINLLEVMGQKVVHELATKIIKEGKYLPWVDRVKFQSEVLRRQLAAEAAILDFDNPIFLDRGAFDGEAYYIADSLPVPPAFSTIDPSQYDLAFLIEELSFFDQNDVRREDLEFTKKISATLEGCYTSRNIRVIRVPAMLPHARVDFIMKHVADYQKSRVRSPEQAAMMFQAGMMQPVVTPV
ncbi:ATP-binding protein [Candidatus Obscuribacterales bacterium]|nr:ATP-binding protein [Candidatus Obscuribacterales bacterium]MBX3137958.1 ATP-binding protein [Candidatus Obscuribacterales bacterium]MBX3148737.1 ATP-binding protein [Candidatus Obscuribacterales bacterium]